MKFSVTEQQRTQLCNYYMQHTELRESTIPTNSMMNTYYFHFYKPSFIIHFTATFFQKTWSCTEKKLHKRFPFKIGIQKIIWCFYLHKNGFCLFGKLNSIFSILMILSDKQSLCNCHSLNYPSNFLNLQIDLCVANQYVVPIEMHVCAIQQ